MNDERGSERRTSESLERVGFIDPNAGTRSGSYRIEDTGRAEASARHHGLTVRPMEAARKEFPWIDALAFSLVDPTSNDAARAVAERSHAAGAFVHVAAGTDVRMPAQSCFVLKSQRSEQLLHNLIVVEEGARLDLISGCATASYDLEGQHTAVTEIFVRRGAALTYTMIHDWAPDVRVRPVSAAHVGAGARFASTYIALTRAKEVTMSPLAIVETGGSASLGSLIYGRTGSRFDIGGRLRLDGAGASGEITSRAVAERCRIVVRGAIASIGATTKGHMECNGIVLEEGGSIHAIPELDARTPDAELSHEAAIGRIGQEKLMYLMSRGLSEEEATSLIVQGFLRAEIEGLPDPLREAIERMIASMSRDSI